MKLHSATILFSSVFVLFLGLLITECSPGKPNSRLAALQKNTSSSVAPVTRQLSTGIQSYTVEPLNDADFLNYPPPPPVHPSTYQFTIAHSPHDEVIGINSTRLRNISVTLENTGSTLIKAPYLYGPRGYDFRNLSKLASTITAGTGLTSEEKFFRIHQWMDEHFVRTEVANDDPLMGMDGTPRRLNQYGGSECGENVEIVGNLLRYVPPLGSTYARKMDLSGLHQP